MAKTRKVHPSQVETASAILAAKKAEFLEHYARLGTLHHAAKAIGHNRQTILNWRHADAAFDTACVEAFEVNTETLEITLYQRALKGTSKGSDSLGMFLMKKRKPEYRENFGIDARHLHAGAIATTNKIHPTVQAAVDAMALDLVTKMAEKL